MRLFFGLPLLLIGLNLKFRLAAIRLFNHVFPSPSRRVVDGGVLALHVIDIGWVVQYCPGRQACFISSEHSSSSSVLLLFPSPTRLHHSPMSLHEIISSSW